MRTIHLIRPELGEYEERGLSYSYYLLGTSRLNGTRLSTLIKETFEPYPGLVL